MSERHVLGAGPVPPIVWYVVQAGFWAITLLRYAHAVTSTSTASGSNS